MVKVINDKAEFKKALEDAGGKLVVVDFYAEWCGPCKMIAPKIEEMSNTMTDVLFLKVDVDKAEDVAEQQGITAMPTFQFFKNGEKIDDLVGANEDKIKEKINAHK